ncbi:hypothetical protein A3Q56_02814 [Intoshia linei]|uniref:Uncharacterized protein n=1 Tax=Intoshia linei TaxID=1819745 RepID=A0A177B569_9BILA|nr:hypothetical protein A3Q56_02814 [Intoshia linei]
MGNVCTSVEIDETEEKRLENVLIQEARHKYNINISVNTLALMNCIYSLECKSKSFDLKNLRNAYNDGIDLHVIEILNKNEKFHFKDIDFNKIVNNVQKSNDYVDSALKFTYMNIIIDISTVLQNVINKFTQIEINYVYYNISENIEELNKNDAINSNLSIYEILQKQMKYPSYCGELVIFLLTGEKYYGQLLPDTLSSDQLVSINKSLHILQEFEILNSINSLYKSVYVDGKIQCGNHKHDLNYSMIRQLNDSEIIQIKNSIISFLTLDEKKSLFKSPVNDEIEKLEKMFSSDTIFYVKRKIVQKKSNKANFHIIDFQKKSDSVKLLDNNVFDMIGSSIDMSNKHLNELFLKRLEKKKWYHEIILQSENFYSLLKLDIENLISKLCIFLLFKKKSIDKLGDIELHFHQQKFSKFFKLNLLFENYDLLNISIENLEKSWINKDNSNLDVFNDIYKDIQCKYTEDMFSDLLDAKIVIFKSHNVRCFQKMLKFVHLTVLKQNCDITYIYLNFNNSINSNNSIFFQCLKVLFSNILPNLQFNIDDDYILYLNFKEFLNLWTKNILSNVSISKNKNIEKEKNSQNVFFGKNYDSDINFFCVNEKNNDNDDNLQNIEYIFNIVQLETLNDDLKIKENLVSIILRIGNSHTSINYLIDLILHIQFIHILLDEVYNNKSCVYFFISSSQELSNLIDKIKKNVYTNIFNNNAMDYKEDLESINFDKIEAWKKKYIFLSDVCQISDISKIEMLKSELTFLNMDNLSNTYMKKSCYNEYNIIDGVTFKKTKIFKTYSLYIINIILLKNTSFKQLFFNLMELSKVYKLETISFMEFYIVFNSLTQYFYFQHSNGRTVVQLRTQYQEIIIKIYIDETLKSKYAKQILKNVYDYLIKKHVNSISLYNENFEIVDNMNKNDIKKMECEFFINFVDFSKMKYKTLLKKKTINNMLIMDNLINESIQFFHSIKLLESVNLDITENEDEKLKNYVIFITNPFVIKWLFEKNELHQIFKYGRLCFKNVKNLLCKNIMTFKNTQKNSDETHQSNKYHNSLNLSNEIKLHDQKQTNECIYAINVKQLHKCKYIDKNVSILNFVLNQYFKFYNILNSDNVYNFGVYIYCILQHNLLVDQKKVNDMQYEPSEINKTNGHNDESVMNKIINLNGSKEQFDTYIDKPINTLESNLNLQLKNKNDQIITENKLKLFPVNIMDTENLLSIDILKCFKLKSKLLRVKYISTFLIYVEYEFEPQKERDKVMNNEGNICQNINMILNTLNGKIITLDDYIQQDSYPPSKYYYYSQYFEINEIVNNESKKSLPEFINPQLNFHNLNQRVEVPQTMPNFEIKITTESNSLRKKLKENIDVNKSIKTLSSLNDSSVNEIIIQKGKICDLNDHYFVQYMVKSNYIMVMDYKNLNKKYYIKNIFKEKVIKICCMNAGRTKTDIIDKFYLCSEYGSIAIFSVNDGMYRILNVDMNSKEFMNSYKVGNNKIDDKECIKEKQWTNVTIIDINKLYDAIEKKRSSLTNSQTSVNHKNGDAYPTCRDFVCCGNYIFRIDSDCAMLLCDGKVEVLINCSYFNTYYLTSVLSILDGLTSNVYKKKATNQREKIKLRSAGFIKKGQSSNNRLHRSNTITSTYVNKSYNSDSNSQKSTESSLFTQIHQNNNTVFIAFTGKCFQIYVFQLTLEKKYIDSLKFKKQCINLFDSNIFKNEIKSRETWNKCEIFTKKYTFSNFILTGHSGWIWCIKINSNLNLLASASSDKSIRLWNLKTKSIHQILQNHHHRVSHIDFNLDLNSIASVSFDGRIIIWDLMPIDFNSSNSINNYAFFLTIYENYFLFMDQNLLVISKFDLDHNAQILYYVNIESICNYFHVICFDSFSEKNVSFYGDELILAMFCLSNENEKKVGILIILKWDKETKELNENNVIKICNNVVSVCFWSNLLYILQNGTISWYDFEKEEDTSTDTILHYTLPCKMMVDSKFIYLFTQKNVNIYNS